ncbi:MAG: sugar phosphate isomerase/epimerase [Clostridiales bacterium]|jgi:sugar phosphate isomerase/epimerase|nr:sugar phosphate isomerase/epimerase [Clostridiales bacterium]
MKTGVVLNNNNMDENFRWCVENNIPTCQLYTPKSFSDEESEKIKKARDESGIEITSMIALGSGPHIYNFNDGPITLGIVPITYRAIRMKELIKSARFSVKLGVKDVCGHLGFIPENPSDSLYAEVVAMVKYLTSEYKKLGARLNLETGQETAITLHRLINDVGADNLGLNFDPANLLMYGKANPLDALDIVGKYVNSVHAKDGEYPTNGLALGNERPLGQGRVNIPLFVKKLISVGYDGALTIEREIEGDEQKQDILEANSLLTSIIEFNGL